MSIEEILKQLEPLCHQLKQERPNREAFETLGQYRKALLNWVEHSVLDEPATRVDLEKLHKRYNLDEKTKPVTTILAWHNGESGEGAIRPDFKLLNIDQILEWQDAIAELGDHLSPMETFVPLFKFDTVVLGVFTSADDQAFYCYSSWDVAYYRMADSLEAFLESTLECLASNRFSDTQYLDDYPHSISLIEKNILSKFNSKPYYPAKDILGVTRFNLT